MLFTLHSAVFAVAVICFGIWPAFVVATDMPSTCDADCLNAAREYKKEELKSAMLRSMGLTKVPVIKKKIHISQGALNILLKKDDFEDESSYIVAEDPSGGTDPTHVAFFPPRKNFNRSAVDKVSFHFHVHLPDSFPLEDFIVVNVRERFHNKSLGKVVATMTTLINRDHFIGMELPIAVLERMFNNETLGIVVESTYDGESLVKHPQQHSHKLWFIIIKFHPLEEENHRQRRDADDFCSDGDNTSTCCLHDLFIDFHEIGWDFVLAPLRYNAYMCKGDCTNDSRQKSSHVKLTKAGLVWDNDHATRIGTCCHPANYDPLKMVYVNSEQEITVTRVPGMIARSCGCN